MNEMKKTLRNRITRMKIGETIVSLLDRFSLADIQVSAVSKLSGISRMTFYNYYESTEAALMDYLTEIINLYQMELIRNGLIDKFMTVDHLEFTFKFFSQYDKLILKLEKIGCYKYIVDCVNTFFEKEYKYFFKDSNYNMLFYSGGILNIFIAWLHNGKKESPRSMARDYQKVFEIFSE